MQEPKPIAIFTADWHASPVSWSNRPTITGDPEHVLAMFCAFVNKHKLPVFAAGDLINVRRPGPQVIYSLQHYLKTLDPSVSVYFTQGQHELCDTTWKISETEVVPTPWLSSLNLPNVKYVNEAKVSLLDEGIVVFASDWKDAEKLTEYLDSLTELFDSEAWKESPESHYKVILMLHQVCDVFMGLLGNCELFSGTIPSRVDMVLTGDYHRRTTSTIKRTDGVPIPIVSPGSLRPTTIDDTEEKGFYVLMSDMSLRSVTIPQRSICATEPIETEEVFEAELKRLIEQPLFPCEKQFKDRSVGKPVVRVVVSSSIPHAEKRIREALSDRYHIVTSVFRVESDGRRVEPEGSGMDSEFTASGVLSRWFSEDAVTEEIAQRLLHSDDVPVTLIECRREFLENI